MADPVYRKVFTLRSHPMSLFVTFLTGSSREEQVLIGFLPPGIVAVFFDQDGKLLRAEEQAFSAERRNQFFGHPLFDQEDPNKVLHPDEWRDFRAWLERIDFEEGPIEVQEFSLYQAPWYSIGLGELEAWDEDEPVAEGERPPQEETAPAGPTPKGAAQAEAILVRHEDLYHFSWDISYYMHPDGGVAAT